MMTPTGIPPQGADVPPADRVSVSCGCGTCFTVLFSEVKARLFSFSLLGNRFLPYAECPKCRIHVTLSPWDIPEETFDRLDRRRRKRSTPIEH
jgi:hypothetical protein